MIDTEKKSKESLLSKLSRQKYRIALQVMLIPAFTFIIEYIYARMEIERINIFAMISLAFTALKFIADLFDTAETLNKAAEKLKKRIPEEILSFCNKTYCKMMKLLFHLKIYMLPILRWSFWRRGNEKKIGKTINRLTRFLCIPISLSLFFAYLAPLRHFLADHRDIVTNYLSVIDGSYTYSVYDSNEIMGDPTFERRIDPPTATFHLEDYPLVLTISEEEFNHLLFIENDIDVDNPHYIFSAVTNRINICRFQPKPDGTITATTQQKNKIADISSRNDRFMSNTQARLEAYPRDLESSATLDKIIEDWLNLPDSVMNYKINWMLSNAYQKYALEYYWQEGSIDTVVYYYARSIEYAHKALEYEATKEEINTTLMYISGRYRDLAFLAHVLDPSERIISTEIADAYAQLAQMYLP